MNNIKFLLLDLDGTLIQFDPNLFIKRYLELIQVHFSEYTYAKSVPQWIMEGTKQMLSNDGTITNKERFLDYFQNKSALSEQKIWEIFTQFYATGFNQLRQITTPMKGAKEFCENCLDAGFRLVIATQPVFPEIAIRKRLKWAGIDHLTFELITHIENMNSCKPYQAYFRQLLEMIDTSSEHCLMIGNDIEMDMAAKQSNIPTYYFVNDAHHVSREIQSADYIGDFKLLGSLLGID